jgi:hypothetical protein
MKGETSEPEKPHESTRGRVAPDYCNGAGARAARYRRAPEPVSRGGCTALQQAHGQALTPHTRRRNGGTRYFAFYANTIESFYGSTIPLLKDKFGSWCQPEA